MRSNSPGRTHAAVIFDLDGVLVDTADLHLQAWTELAAGLGFTLPAHVGDQLRGIGRRAALDIVLAAGDVRLDESAATAAARRKNERYVELLDGLGRHALLPGAAEALSVLQDGGVPVALASASKNARRVLQATGIEVYFDVVIDGTVVAEAKPSPRVFLVAAEGLRMPAPSCIVVEDAPAGVAGARAAGMTVAGVGRADLLAGADLIVTGLEDIDWRSLVRTGLLTEKVLAR